ncbi:MAG: biosynthesis protein [Ramlibacter sp.]|nr:biosynthesis protein [Ramlibacter sp.]
MSLSVVVIALNEAANLRACLESVSFADEIVVLDGGSSDGTVAIAQACGARVSRAAGWPGFGPQKNRALALATGDWVLSLDADERVTPALAAQILAAMASGTAGAYEIPRLTRFCGSWIHHCGWTPDRVLRLFRRGQARFSDDLVHERVITELGTRPARLTSPLLHESYPTPAHYWRKLEAYSQAWALQQHRRGRKTSMARAGAAAGAAFLRSYLLRLGFLDGAMGFAVCTMQAQAAFGKYFALYCLNRQDDPRPPAPPA